MDVGINTSMCILILPEPDQGNGIWAVCATILEEILSPRTNIAFSGGPINAILFLSNSLCSSGFSLACPQPAHTAYCKYTEIIHTSIQIQFITYFTIIL